MSLGKRGRKPKNGLPQYVWGRQSPSGKVTWYYRRRGQYVPLSGELWSREWVADYNAALNGEPKPDRRDHGIDRIRKGTFAEVIATYKQTAAYKQGSQGTIWQRNSQLNYIVDTLQLGDRSVEALKLIQLEAIIEKRAEETVAAAKQLLGMFRALYDRAIKMEIVGANLAKTVTEPKGEKTEGHKDWPEPLIERYQRRHPLGTMARVALEIFLNNGFRIGDASRVGWWCVKDGIITDFITEKTKKSITVEIGPDLSAAIAAMGGLPSLGNDIPWLVGPRGPMGTKTLWRAMRRWCAEANIPAEYTSHGLRHSVARRLMDRGVSIEDAMAVTGHTDRRVFLHYAQKRDERLAAERAMAIYAAPQKNRPKTRI